jgi:predicted negative regulator of RcsB-dependent stress response
MKNFALGTALLLGALAASAQSPIRLPDASPAAVAGQTIGITDVTITYHRPAVNKRRIWGGLVGYDTPWRAGANENTTISFSTPVKIEGQPLAAGTYALYAIPTAGPWTIIFSKFTGDWGAYGYDPSEDALRVQVTPQTMGESQERLAYTFDDLTDNSGVVSLRWEKLRVPVKVEVDLRQTVRASIDSTLRGGKYWDPAAWTTAARWQLRNGDLDAALASVNHSLSLQTTASALRTKGAVLEKKGDAAGAAEARQRAASLATEADTIAIGYNTLLGAKKYDEAIAFLTSYETAHPSSRELWRVYAGLGDAYSAKGDKTKAKQYYDRALSTASNSQERTEVWDSINAASAEVKP